jgi:hypothetical protein
MSADQGCMRVLAEVGSNAEETVHGALVGMPKVFVVLEALGTELTCVVGPIGDSSRLPD